MANPYRTPAPREPTPRSREDKLLTGSVAFCCVCVIAGWALAKLDSLPGVILSAAAGAAIIARGPRLRH